MKLGCLAIEWPRQIKTSVVGPKLDKFGRIHPVWEHVHWDQLIVSQISHLRASVLLEHNPLAQALAPAQKQKWLQAFYDAHRAAPLIAASDDTPGLTPEFTYDALIVELHENGISDAYIQQSQKAHVEPHVATGTYPLASSGNLLVASLYTHETLKLYSRVNDSLREVSLTTQTPSLERWPQFVWHLITAIPHLATPNSTLYRGQRFLFAQDDAQYDVGKRVRMKSFTSTSLVREVAEQFAQRGVLFILSGVPRDISGSL
eukprot:COSAG02_NODE_10427_length_1943_cov_1.127440_1_plen_259_part_10